MHLRTGKIRVFLLLLFCSAAMAAAQQWQPLGPDGGSVRSLTLDPGYPDHVFLGTSAGRLYLSTDSGATWTRLAHLGSSSEMVLDHIVIDPSQPNNIYIAAWNAQAPTSDGDLFRSRDGGESWQRLDRGLPSRAWHTVLRQAMCIDAHPRPGLYFGTTAGEVWGSNNGGESWSCLVRHLPEIYSVTHAA